MIEFSDTNILDLRGRSDIGGGIGSGSGIGSDSGVLNNEDYLLASIKCMFGNVEIRCWTVPPTTSGDSGGDSGGSGSSIDSKLADELILKDALDKIPISLLKCSDSVECSGSSIKYWVAEMSRSNTTTTTTPTTTTGDSNNTQYELCGIITSYNTTNSLPTIRIRLPLASHWSEVTLKLRFTLILKFYSLSLQYSLEYNKFRDVEKMMKKLHNDELNQFQRRSEVVLNDSANSYRELLYKRTLLMKTKVSVCVSVCMCVLVLVC